MPALLTSVLPSCHAVGHRERRVTLAASRAERIGAAPSLTPASVAGAEVASGAGAIEIEAVFDRGVAHLVEAAWERLGVAAAIASTIAEKQLTEPHLAASRLRGRFSVAPQELLPSA